MKLRSIKIKNFRQINGEQDITFSSADDKNVTVIHGKNGAGKTSILNAFKWCFYGKTDFETKTDNILNKKAIFEAGPNAKVILSIQIEFDNDGDKYRAIRTAHYITDSSADTANISQADRTIFQLWITRNSDGQTLSMDSPDLQINRIIPENLQPYFFFNGERIEKLSLGTSRDKIQSAIRSLMGIDVLERGASHLSTSAKKYFTAELRKSASASEKDKIDDCQRKRDQLEEHKVKSQEAKANRDANANASEAIGIQLKNMQETAKLQTRREEVNLEIKELDKDLINISSDRLAFISKKSFLIYSQELFKDIAIVLEEGRKKGELPYKIKEQFIDDLLSKKVCICDRDIDTGSDEELAIKSYRNTSGNNDLEEVFMEVSSGVKRIDIEAEEIEKALNDFQFKFDGSFNAKEKFKVELDEIGSKLLSPDNIDISSLEKKYKEHEENIKKYDHALGYHEGILGDLQEEIKSLERDISAIEIINAGNALISSRLSVVNELTESYHQMIDALSNEVRKDLAARVNKTFQGIIRKPYEAEISDDFSLQIHEILPDGRKVLVIEKSTAESQISSLSFIGSLIAHAKDSKKRGKTKFIKAGIFPLVMDSPFGAMDPEYRALVAKSLPDLAEQVIILVSDSQWNGSVEIECTHRIGKAYTLDLHGGNEANDQQNTVIKEISNA
jgi:DNA sulfur modification protein DndD